jgi:hypothetical protein
MQDQHGRVELTRVGTLKKWVAFAVLEEGKRRAQADEVQSINQSMLHL